MDIRMIPIPEINLDWSDWHSWNELLLDARSNPKANVPPAAGVHEAKLTSGKERLSRYCQGEETNLPGGSGLPGVRLYLFRRSLALRRTAPRLFIASVNQPSREWKDTAEVWRVRPGAATERVLPVYLTQRSCMKSSNAWKSLSCSELP